MKNLVKKAIRREIERQAGSDEFDVIYVDQDFGSGAIVVDVDWHEGFYGKEAYMISTERLLISMYWVERAC